jgi:competence protein ComEA
VLPRVLLVCALGVLAVLAVALLWQKPSDEGFALTTAESAASGTDDGTLASEAPDASGGSDGSGDSDARAKATEPPETPAPVPLVIYLTGAVIAPGVYELEQGDRVNDLIERAGGLAEDAATNYVNLAAPLADALHVHIPSQAEIESGEAARIAASGATGTAGAGAGGGAGGSGLLSSADGQQVNLNTADSAALETLPGVGAATARRIIDYREKNGPFESVEDLKDVSGIGEKKFAELADRVCV